MMRAEIRIGDRIIGEGRPPFLIAEAGVNYFDIAKKNNMAPLEAARLMINQAAKAGADAIKFQTYKADKLVIKQSPAYWDTTEETSTSQYELFQKYDAFGEREYRELAECASQNNIVFMSTPFDEEAVDFLDEMMPVFKISSSDITNTPFLKHIAKKKRPVFLSTGASTIDEINEAVSTISNLSNNSIVLMHCVLNYPTQYEHANLRMIETLRDTFPELLIGYSDHTRADPDMLVLLSAYLLGAVVIEKHFTLNKSLPGNDHYHAMDTEDLRKAKDNLKLAQLLLKPAASDTESAARKYARRSVVAKAAILKGTIITADMLTCKRPGTGISPKFIDNIIRKKTKANIAADSLVTWEMVGGK